MNAGIRFDINEELSEGFQSRFIVSLNPTDCALPVHAADNEGRAGFLHPAPQVAGVLGVLPVPEAAAHPDPHQVSHGLWPRCQH